jgi:AraC-like DNA-binding protein
MWWMEPSQRDVGDAASRSDAEVSDGDAVAVELSDTVRSRCFAFGVTSHQLVVTVAWGSIDEAEALTLGGAWRKTFDGPTRDTLVDSTHLVMSDAGAFASLRDLLERHREERARVVRRQAVVMREDWSGVFVRGYLALYPPPYEMRAFADRGEALDWLGHRCCLPEIEELESARVDVLARLREWLEGARLEEATIERAVAELGVTSRTLQRRLLSAGTRFTAELARAQVARAQRLMRDPARKLSEIALEVGCASPSTFSDLFRRVTGETPSQWRRRHS